MKTKKFELTVTLTDDGRYGVEGKNDGFNALDQLNHPEKFKHTRVAVVDGEQIAIEEVEK